MESKAFNLRQAANIESEILAALQGLRYGSLEITVHDSRVVQIERTEKYRYDGKIVPDHKLKG